jgi:hypothetical protein
VRYVESDPLILTAGGLSSGIDAALHVVELYYGPQVAQATADNLEYQGQGWKTNAGAGEPREIRPTIPLAYRDRETLWQGTFLPAYPKPQPAMPVTLHLAQVDGQYRGTLDAPTESMIGEPLDDVQVGPGSIHFTLASEHGPVDFSGSLSADRISGNVTHGGSSPTPLTFTRAGASSPAPK